MAVRVIRRDDVQHLTDEILLFDTTDGWIDFDLLPLDTWLVPKLILRKVTTDGNLAVVLCAKGDIVNESRVIPLRYRRDFVIVGRRNG
jgi:hypothetical protein